MLKYTNPDPEKRVLQGISAVEFPVTWAFFAGFSRKISQDKKVPNKRLKTLIKKKYVIGNQKSLSLPEYWVGDFKLLNFRDIHAAVHYY
ncbi:MAG TPA: hypothetical protein VGK06_09150 [Methanosarcina sp.]